MPTNPKKTENGTAPAHDLVVATYRPNSVADLFDNTDFVSIPYFNQVKLSSRFYLSGLNRLMNFFPSKRAPWLKTGGFINKAVEVIKAETNWCQQTGVDISDRCSAAQLRSAYGLKALYFTKPMIIMVAAELAIESVAPEKKYWVYDHMRIMPSVWNIDRLSPDVLRDLTQAFPDLIDQLKTAAGQGENALFDDMAAGYSVTWTTAKAVHDVVERLKPGALGDIRCYPGRHAGTLGPTENERVS